MGTESTDQIGKAYKDRTTAPATRTSITQNTWLNCVSLVFVQDKPDRERRFVPNQCVFKGNAMVRTEPQKAPLVRLSLIEGFQTSENTAQGSSKEGWLEWFKWETSLPAMQKPKTLNAAEVGPDASES